jgi:hypothetical protein
VTPVAAEFTGSGSGEVEGQVVPVNINLVGDRANLDVTSLHNRTEGAYGIWV